ncbi:MAG: hypothetical protein JWM53_897, partial [bacterium]|nr:hypothetical protein [bacterium]
PTAAEEERERTPGRARNERRPAQQESEDAEADPAADPNGAPTLLGA